MSLVYDTCYMSLDFKKKYSVNIWMNERTKVFNIEGPLLVNEVFSTVMKYVLCIYVLSFIPSTVKEQQ